MTAEEKANKAQRMMYKVLDFGRLVGKAEAYQHMFSLLRKTRLKTSNPKLVLDTMCLSLDSIADSLEIAKDYLSDSPTVAKQIEILTATISTLSDKIRMAVNDGRYEEAFRHIRKANRDIKQFMKEQANTFQVYMEVQKKRLEEMFK